MYVLTYSGRFDAELALSVYQAVLNDSKEARIGICCTDTDYGGAQVHVFKHRLLQTQKSKHTLWLRDSARRLLFDFTCASYNSVYLFS